MISTNKDRLPVKSMIGTVKPVSKQSFGLMVMDPDGQGQYRVGTGGVSYNYKLGDSCRALVGSHVQPGVSTEYGGPMGPSDPMMGSPYAMVYTQCCCVGNKAVVLGGPLDGKTGYVTGKITSGGVTLGFDDEVIAQMNGTERFAIRACGVGLAIEGEEDVMVHNIDPELFEKLGITEKDGVYSVPVKKIIPGFLVGAGVGGGVITGSGQLMTDNGGENDTAYGLDKLCVGDFIAITDMDMTSGRTFWEGAVAICLVVSGDCESTGAGPHIMTVLASKTAKIQPVLQETANLANLLDLNGKE